MRRASSEMSAQDLCEGSGSLFDAAGPEAVRGCTHAGRHGAEEVG